ncbi:sensor histidine kinase [Chthonobacter albigriseus]|uniref:sensor histidine kinase n=1 Tax=Chthonobacter albigriseus TaxID=1683161 RepID=UPI0015EE5D24|nr:sensor histidine kinase [Chthonobacter albigriseus]
MKTARSYSIARRLAIAGGASVVAFVAVMALIVISFSDRASNEAYDRLLLASAQSIADAIRIVGADLTVDVPISAFSMLAIGKSDRIFYRVTEEPSSAITGYGDLAPGFRFAPGRDVAYADDVYLGLPVRVAATRRLISAAGEPRRVVVLVAETRESRQVLAAEIRTYALVPLFVVCVAAVVMIPFSIRQVMRPIAALEQTVKAREPTDLGPLDPPSVPREIAPLVEALDHFVARLKETLAQNRAFIDETAHQLRTPLASLRGMAEVAANEQDPVALRNQIARIHRSAVSAARITNQLLADAAVANRLQTGRRQAVRLDMLAAEAVNDAVGFSGARTIRFDVSEAAEGTLVAADSAALREAVRNLIENALVHGAPGGTVEVTVERPNLMMASVQVADRGPGIPAEEKPRLLRRFERGAGAGEGGSGLGLAIVERVAVAHGGTVSLEDREGGGLVASIRLPVQDPYEGA